MKGLKSMFKRGPRDERLAAQLGDIYRVGFYILSLGIIFDLYTRYNYITWTAPDGNAISQNPLEWLVLMTSLIVVCVMMFRRGVYTDSLRYTEASTFLESGALLPAVGLGLLVAIAAVGGRLYCEVTMLGWDQVTWAGDLAMLVVMILMFVPALAAIQYLGWRSFRKAEDRKAAEEDD